MSHRFYVDAEVAGDRVTLADNEAHHLIHVLRAQVGQQLIVFDGTGHEYQVQVEQISRNQAVLSVLSSEFVDRESSIDLTLAVGLPKGDRQRFLVEKLVELGATRLIPLSTRFGVAQPTPKAVDRLRRTVIEASKQCRRNQLMEITAAADLEQLIQTAAAADCRILAHPMPSGQHSAGIPIGTTVRSVCVAVGPEGGFADGEVQRLLHSDWQPADLGPRILRVETAALAIASRLLLWP